MFNLDTPTDRLSDAVFRYGRALTRDLRPTRFILRDEGWAVSTFYDDLADLLLQTTDEDRIQQLTTCFWTCPTQQAYPIDYRLKGDSGGQVFLYGVPNRDKARLDHDHPVLLSPKPPTTSIRFWSSGNQVRNSQNGPGETARMWEGTWSSSLDSSEDLRRKLERRIA